jgi:hypothetical protein
MLADIGFRKTELVGQNKRLAIFPERNTPILVEWMDRHGEETQFHRALAPERRFKAFASHYGRYRKGEPPEIIVR